MLKEKDRKPIKRYNNPIELQKVMQSFQYRKDPLDGRIDYVSHPEYVQAVIDDKNIFDGDCDDAHFYVANALQQTTGVEEVYLLSSGWDGPRGEGAHASAVYKYNGKWYLFDWAISGIEDPDQAPYEVARRHGGVGSEVTFWIWESVGEYGENDHGWQPVAICPNHLGR